ncbi:MAG: hypothetical protein HQ494_06000 [Rhodospirillales bacterium]|nr:hypothetical protein [Rhodospirillales bacterium]
MLIPNPEISKNMIRKKIKNVAPFIISPIVLGSAFTMGVAGIAPYVGLGMGKNFFLNPVLGVTQETMFNLGLTGFLLSGLALAVYVLGFMLTGYRSSHSGQNTALIRQINFAMHFWRAINRDWVVVILLIPFAIYVSVFALYSLPGIPWMAPDSMTYIGFSPIRTLLYPLLLRVIALFFDQPIMLVAVPLLMGLTATVFLAEIAQRLIRNVLVSFSAGLLLLFNWPLIEHAVYLLSDYSFYAFYTVTLGIVLIAIRDPRPRWLMLIAVFGVLTMAVRPIGFVVFIAIPFLLMTDWRLWRRVTAYLIVPLILLCLAVSSINWVVFDYFAMSRFSGYPVGSNTALLLKPDTPTQHPELRDRIVEFAKPYKEEIAGIKGTHERFRQVVNTGNPLISGVGDITIRYGREKGLVTYSNTETHKRLVSYLNSLSPLNRTLAEIPIQVSPRWAWIDETLYKLGRQAHLNNTPDLMRLSALKMWFSWKSVVTSYGVKSNFRVQAPFTPGAKGLGISLSVTDPPREDIPFVNVDTFNLIDGLIRKLGRRVSLPLIVALVTVFTVVLMVFQLIRRQAVSPVTAGLAFLGSVTVLYHLIVSVAQFPIGRFFVVVQGGPGLLLFSPLLAMPLMYKLGADWVKARDNGSRPQEID